MLNVPDPNACPELIRFCNELDRRFLEAKSEDYDEADRSLRSLGEAILSHRLWNLHSQLQIVRAVLQRRLILSIQRKRPFAECLALFQELNGLGFEDVVEKSLLFSEFGHYCT